MDDLVQFLRDRLVEDQREAAAASPGPWHVDAEADEVLAVDDIVVAEGFALSGRQLRATTRHIARHDPARVLREVEAKRQLIDWVLRWPMRPAPPSSVDGVLERLALPYSDHPDYQDTWRP
ncbi:DUF6221 family protein [Streptomyces sp. NPDC059698]|uniref:DUF6221 family protein n=1 Tax=unclassified Streptomyces TaxID=2593676 RepID=UPI00093FB105|nr:DUF6221 family protein [Streptomyces sp. CB02366]OKJ38262.1 hypothetical protein AMK24_11460 [Streptomyces sp. CB02366]